MMSLAQGQINRVPSREGRGIPVTIWQVALQLNSFSTTEYGFACSNAYVLGGMVNMAAYINKFRSEYRNVLSYPVYERPIFVVVSFIDTMFDGGEFVREFRARHPRG